MTPTVAVTAAANAAAADPVAVRVVAEVLRVRRVARLLAFATLRPLGAPVTVELDAHDRAARRASEVDGDERGFSSATFAGEALPLAAGTELQLIADVPSWRVSVARPRWRRRFARSGKATSSRWRVGSRRILGR